MFFLKEFYFKNRDVLEETPYGRLILSFKNGEDRFWIVKPKTEEHQLAIHNLNHSVKSDNYADVYNKNLPYSLNWERSYVYLTDSESPIYKDIFLKMKSNSYPEKMNVSPNQCSILMTDMTILNKACNNKIIPINEDSFYKQLLDPNVKTFSYNGENVTKENLDIKSFSIKSLKEKSRIF